MSLPLAGSEFAVVDASPPVLSAAADLLRGLGAQPLSRPSAAAVRPSPSGTLNPSADPSFLGTLELPVDLPPALSWARSGAMALTGPADGAPLAPDLPIVARLEGAMAVFRLLAASRGAHVDALDAGALLGERAAISRLSRGGRVSAGGAARLLPARDGWVAMNLARSADLDLLPAWLSLIEAPVDPPGKQADPWPLIERALAGARAHTAVENAQLLGLPMAEVAQPETAAADEQASARGQRFPFAPFLIDGRIIDGGAAFPPASTSDRRPATPTDRPITVVDLSSLWAGPLCAHLLGLAGARVIKVESVHRPDGARSGPKAFFDLLHAGHESLTLDLRAPDGRDTLIRLITRADVVIEASRPRALAQLGIDPAELLLRNPTLTWVSITGYGRTGPWCQRVAFGDDAAATAGLVAVGADGTPMFLADAIADPVTGLYSAVAALACVVGGGGHHVDIALREAAGSLLGARARLSGSDPAASWSPAPGGAEACGWFVEAEGRREAVLPPRHRVPTGVAPAFGADNARILKEIIKC